MYTSVIKLRQGKGTIPEDSYFFTRKKYAASGRTQSYDMQMLYQLRYKKQLSWVG